MANDLFQALEMFNKGATELAVSRSIRSAAEQAQMINQNEQDEFAKRQQLTQLGQGLAMQLSSFGANPAQIQQSVGAFMPQQLGSPQDFFAASQNATSAGSKQQLEQAGLDFQAQNAAMPLTKAQEEEFRLRRYQLLNEATALRNAGGKQSKLIEQINEEDKQMITDLGKDNAKKVGVANLLKNFIDQYDRLETEEQKINFAQLSLPKVINSVPGGLDAVGSEEVKRLMSLVQRAGPLGNLTDSNVTSRAPFTRDLEGFRKGVGSLLEGTQKAAEQNYSTINDTYKKYGASIPIPKLVNAPEMDKSLNANIERAEKDYAALQQKFNTPGAMNDAERLQATMLLQKLKEKKEKLAKMRK